MIAVLGHGTLCLVSVKRAKAASVLAIAVGLLGTEIEEDARGALPSAQLKEEEDFQDTPEAVTRQRQWRGVLHTREAGSRTGWRWRDSREYQFSYNSTSTVTRVVHTFKSRGVIAV